MSKLTFNHVIRKWREELHTAQKNAKSGRLMTDRAAGNAKAEFIQKAIRQVEELETQVESRHLEDRKQLARRVTQAVEGEK